MFLAEDASGSRGLCGGSAGFSLPYGNRETGTQGDLSLNPLMISKRFSALLLLLHATEEQHYGDFVFFLLF